MYVYTVHINNYIVMHIKPLVDIVAGYLHSKETVF